MLFDTTIQNLILILKHGKQVINAVLRFAVNAILITCKEIILILKHKISSIYFPFNGRDKFTQTKEVKATK